MSDNKKEIEVPIEHPLEEHFGIESGTTMVPKTIVDTEVVPYEPYDEKDEELDGQFQNIHDAAMTAFEEQQEESDVIDPKYKARNAEVAVQFLNTALNASSAKAQLKQFRDKLEVSKVRAGAQITEAGAQMDRNEILRMMQERAEQKKEGQTFDQEMDADDADFEDTDD